MFNTRPYTGLDNTYNELRKAHVQTFIISFADTFFLSNNTASVVGLSKRDLLSKCFGVCVSYVLLCLCYMC